MLKYSSFHAWLALWHAQRYTDQHLCQQKELSNANANVQCARACGHRRWRGKPGPQAAHGARQGINNYTDWFAGDNDMRGDYYGYDGPCPPWNDEIIHHYVFTVYALDIEQLPLAGKFGGPEVRAAIAGHVLADACLTGTYTLNPRLGT